MEKRKKDTKNEIKKEKKPPPCPPPFEEYEIRKQRRRQRIKIVSTPTKGTYQLSCLTCLPPRIDPTVSRTPPRHFPSRFPSHPSLQCLYKIQYDRYMYIPTSVQYNTCPRIPSSSSPRMKPPHPKKSHFVPCVILVFSFLHLFILSYSQSYLISSPFSPFSPHQVSRHVYYINYTYPPFLCLLLPT